MWNIVIGLLGIRYTAAQREIFAEDLRNCNDWVYREYQLTVEEVALAYNLAITGKLEIDKVIPVIAPKYVAEVLTAYNQWVQGNAEIAGVYRQQQQLDEEPVTPTEEQIDKMMNQALNQAVGEVEMGGMYGDTGGGLYAWLYKKGYLVPNDDVWSDYLNKAQTIVKESLVNQKAAIPHHTATFGDNMKRKSIEKQLADIINEVITPDYRQQVRNEAKRLCLHDYLLTLAGPIEVVEAAVRRSGAEVVVETTKFVAFSHENYIAQLLTDLPGMTDGEVADLQNNAQSRNLLDVYRYATNELDRRLNQKP